jgi:hypothetical protein
MLFPSDIFRLTKRYGKPFPALPGAETFLIASGGFDE